MYKCMYKYLCVLVHVGAQICLRIEGMSAKTWNIIIATSSRDSLQLPIMHSIHKYRYTQTCTQVVTD